MKNIFLLIALCFMLLSCDFLNDSGGSYLIKFPLVSEQPLLESLPLEQQQGLVYRLEIYHHQAQLRSYQATAGSNLSVSLNSDSVLLAYPLVELDGLGEQQLKPLATWVLASSNNKESLFLDWRRGLMAEVLIRGLAQGVPLHRFNLDRIAGKMVNDSPWLLNELRLKKQIDQLNLRWYDFTSKLKLITIPNYQADKWRSDLQLNLPSNEKGELQLPVGLHLLYNPSTKVIQKLLINQDSRIIVLSQQL